MSVMGTSIAAASFKNRIENAGIELGDDVASELATEGGGRLSNRRRRRRRSNNSDSKRRCIKTSTIFHSKKT